MKTIQLTKGKQVIVDDEDFDELSKHKWCITAGYASRRVGYDEKRGGRIMLMHRHLTSAPSGMEVDHVNGDKLDNRRSNLRVVTRQQNLMNQGLRSDNVSGYSGINWNKRYNKWRVRVWQGGKEVVNLHFVKLDDAVKARKRVALETYGEFARVI